MAPCNNLTSSRTLDDAASEFRKLLNYVRSRWPRVIVMDFPPCLAGKVELQTLLRQEYHRVAASVGIPYFHAAGYFPFTRPELWSWDGIHLSDSDGMAVLVQLLWQACYYQLEKLEMEASTPTTPVPPPPSRRATRRVSPRVVCTGSLPVPRPPPSEWTDVEQGRKKNQSRGPKSSLVGPHGKVVQPEVENVFSIPLSPVLFSPAMLVEMDKISPSHLGSVLSTATFPTGKKMSPPRRQKAVARRTCQSAGPSKSPSGMQEHKPVVEVMCRRSPPSSSPGMEVGTFSPSSVAMEEDQAVVPVSSSVAVAVRHHSPATSSTQMAMRRHSSASSTSGMEDVSQETVIKPAASRRLHSKCQMKAAVLEVRPGSSSSSMSEMEEKQVEPGVVEVAPGTSPTSVVVLDEVQFGDVRVTPDRCVVFMDQIQESSCHVSTQPSHHTIPPVVHKESASDRGHKAKSCICCAHQNVCDVSDGESEMTFGSSDEEMEVGSYSGSRLVDIPSCVRGSFHQGADCFKYRGVQCMVMALVALAKHSVLNVCLWKQADLDWVLYLGDALYTERRDKNLTGGHDLLLVTDLPQKAEIDGHPFEFVFGWTFNGAVNVVAHEFLTAGAWVTLEDGLDRILAQYDTSFNAVCQYLCSY
ncbi:uncharacterized protein LOC115439435 [Sphaeramia orbicularis]|uniref:uncharacterized protein LOC115439435 n=1 Tax=Sphaeramia orbicularis TaxID=375764 RepID=UPI00117D548B|nr:uncharacterized protein LOC115439435 [Sphaeramia orbicularis]